MSGPSSLHAVGTGATVSSVHLVTPIPDASGKEIAAWVVGLFLSLGALTIWLATSKIKAGKMADWRDLGGQLALAVGGSGLLVTAGSAVAAWRRYHPPTVAAAAPALDLPAPPRHSLNPAAPLQGVPPDTLANLNALVALIKTKRATVSAAQMMVIFDSLAASPAFRAMGLIQRQQLIHPLVNSMTHTEAESLGRTLASTDKAPLREGLGLVQLLSPWDHLSLVDGLFGGGLDQQRYETPAGDKLIQDLLKSLEPQHMEEAFKIIVTKYATTTPTGLYLRKCILESQRNASAAPHPSGTSASAISSPAVTHLPPATSLLVEDLRTRIPQRLSATEMLNILRRLFKDPVFTALNPAAQVALLDPHLGMMEYMVGVEQLGRELANLGSMSDKNRDARPEFQEWILRLLNPWNGRIALVRGVMEGVLAAPDNPYHVRLIQQLFSLPVEPLHMLHFRTIVQTNWKAMPDTLRQAASASIAVRDRSDPLHQYFQEGIQIALNAP